MAKIVATSDEKVYAIQKWLGLHESPDGDTGLKMGEAAVMRNFSITRDGSLQRRYGTELVSGLLDYETQEAETEEIFREETVAVAMTMYPSAEVQNGFVVLSGEAVSVNEESAADHAGYYYQQSPYRTWKFTRFEEGETHKWYGRRVLAVSPSQTPDVKGLWAGRVAGEDKLLAACDGKLWELYNGAAWETRCIGTLETANGVSFFGFSGKVYILNGSSYKEWDGSELRDVEGYVPLVLTAVSPAGGGATLEQVNRLTPKRRVWFSPDGEAAEFVLPEDGLLSIDAVTRLSDGAELEAETDPAAGRVVFAEAPEAGTNTIEVCYTARTDARGTVASMRFAELYNGTTDNRVFLYGDGSNRTIYSGLDTAGTPRADYFPEMNVISVGEENEPITGMLRHYARLAVYKTNSAWSIQYGTMSLADGSTIAAFYVTGVNRSIGNAAPGQVRLVLNSPRTLHGSDLYEWRNNSSYASNLTTDERQARRISDKVYKTLGLFRKPDCFCWDDDQRQEYYILYGDEALVHNYAADAWYYYTGLNACCMVSLGGELFFGTRDGSVKRFSASARNDCGEAIDAYWESGSLSFGADFRRKYSSLLWLTTKPEASSSVSVTVETDRITKNTVKKSAYAAPASFATWRFSSFSFAANSKPQTTRLKIKAKKFVYWKLILTSDEPDTTCTVLAADVRVRFTGYAK